MIKNHVIVKSAIANARYVIAQVNSHMPKTFGNSFVHVNNIDTLVPYDEQIIESAVPHPDEILRRIGQNIARLVEDGSTIECGTAYLHGKSIRERVLALINIAHPKFRTQLIQAAEVAFIVQDEWQKKGMGTFLLAYLTQIAKQRGVKRFYAKVLPTNKSMLAIFHNSGYKVNTEFDGDVYNIAYDLKKQE